MKYFPRRFLQFALICLLGMGVAMAASGPRDPQRYFFDESFWDLTEELETAREQGKQGIMIMFEMDECPFCHRMKQTILNQPDVQDYFKQHFLILPIDIEGDVEMVNFRGENTIMKDFAFKEYRVRATPVFAFFDLDGKYIKRARFTGAAGSKQEFLLLGRYVVEKEYEKQPFARFKRAQGK
jgi:thioredoxin-related protein